MKHDIPVFLNDGRPYVQGTQMVTRAAEWVSETSETNEVILCMAAFRSITENLVQIRLLENTDVDVIASAKFEADGLTREIGFFDTGVRAPEDNVPPTCTYVRSSGAPKDSEQIFKIENVGGMEDLLVAIVQATKIVHSGLADDVTDIWFTGLRNARIPLDTVIDESLMSLKQARVMGKSPNWQTLTKIDLGGAGLQPMLVSFSFKSTTYQPTG